MPKQLSGGQQQRVAIARALSAKPAIILADEPTGNLDSKTGMNVISLLKVTSRDFNQTMIMITHNEEIAIMADRMVGIEEEKFFSCLPSCLQPLCLQPYLRSASAYMKI